MLKIGRFSIENTREVFKNKKYREILKENVWEFAWDRGWKDIDARQVFNYLKKREKGLWSTFEVVGDKRLFTCSESVCQCEI